MRWSPWPSRRSEGVAQAVEAGGDGAGVLTVVAVVEAERRQHPQPIEHEAPTVAGIGAGAEAAGEADLVAVEPAGIGAEAEVGGAAQRPAGRGVDGEILVGRGSEQVKTLVGRAPVAAVRVVRPRAAVADPAAAGED